MEGGNFSNQYILYVYWKIFPVHYIHHVDIQLPVLLSPQLAFVLQFHNLDVHCDSGLHPSSLVTKVLRFTLESLITGGKELKTVLK